MSEPMSTTLRAEILGRALEQRSAGRPVDAPPPSDPLDAYAAAASQLATVLCGLDDDAWAALAHEEIGTVRELVVHLVGVERLSHTWVTAPADAPATPSEHIDAARGASRDLDDVDTAGLVTTWVAATEQVLAACTSADRRKPVLANDLPTDVDGFLVLRAFELWAHTLDVCRATGVTPPATEPARLSLMSTRLMGAVPLALAVRGAHVSTPALRFVLTGSGGGVHDVELGPADSTEPLVIVVDTTDVCLVAARRLDPELLDAAVDGDPDDAEVILAALDTFARD